ncbi:MAG: hypothetical protein WC759_00110, partial [Candidatus Micrarchaeia archaeon]
GEIFDLRLFAFLKPARQPIENALGKALRTPLLGSLVKCSVHIVEVVQEMYSYLRKKYLLWKFIR